METQQQSWNKLTVKKPLSENLNFIHDSQLRFNVFGELVNSTHRPGLQWRPKGLQDRVTMSILMGFMDTTSDIERRPTLQMGYQFSTHFKLRVRYEFRIYQGDHQTTQRMRYQIQYNTRLTQELKLVVANELNFNTYQQDESQTHYLFEKNRLSAFVLFSQHPLKPMLGPVFEYLPHGASDNSSLGLWALQLQINI